MGLASSPLSLILCAAALVAATSAATPAPPHILQSTTRARIPDDACTFRVYEIQMCNATVALLPPSTMTYIQINKVFAADGSVAVDVAALRPRQQYHSYRRLDPEKVFDVAQLGEGQRLSVRMGKGSEGLKFVYGDLEWESSNTAVEEGRAWCEVGEWASGDEEWTCESGRDRRNRVSQLDSYALGREDQTR